MSVRNVDCVTLSTLAASSDEEERLRARYEEMFRDMPPAHERGAGVVPDAAVGAPYAKAAESLLST